MKHKWLTTACLSLLALLEIGCAVNWSYSPPLPYEREDIWYTSYQVIARRYRIDKANQEEGTMETEWKTRLSPFFKDGYRNKVYFEIEEPETEEIEEDETESVEEEQTDTADQNKTSEKPKKIFYIKVKVEKERNDNIDNPAALIEADWFPVGNNLEEEQALLNFVMQKLNAKYGKNMKDKRKDEEKIYNDKEKGPPLVDTDDDE